MGGVDILLSFFTTYPFHSQHSAPQATFLDSQTLEHHLCGMCCSIYDLFQLKPQESITIFTCGIRSLFTEKIISRLVINRDIGNSHTHKNKQKIYTDSNVLPFTQMPNFHSISLPTSPQLPLQDLMHPKLFTSPYYNVLQSSCCKAIIS